MAEGTRMQQRRAVESVWNTSEYVLAAGELGVTTDTGIIKVGDGASTWSELDPAFGSEYLTVLGKAADSNLLDGIDATGFIQTADATVDPTADKVGLRYTDGRLQVGWAADPDDAVNLSRLTAEVNDMIGVAEPLIREIDISRSVVANFTVDETDVGHMVMVAHSSTTTYVNAILPDNAIVPIPVGSWVDICANGNGALKITVAAGVTVVGFPYISPNQGMSRVVKTATNQWFAFPIGNHHQQKTPKIRVYKNTSGQSYASNVYTAVQYTTVDAVETHNPGDEWFSLPSPDLPTGRRVIVNQTGEYEILTNFTSTIGVISYVRIAKMTSNNTPGETLSVAPMQAVANVHWRGRLVAGESVGVTHAPTGASATDSADSTAINGNRNELRIIRVGN